MNEKLRLNQLLEKYVSKTINSAELQELRQLMDKNAAQDMDDVLSNYWNKYVPSSEVVVPESIRSNIKDVIQPQTATKKLNYWWAVAAILVLGLLSYPIYNALPPHTKSMDMMAKNTKVSVGKGERASITLADGSKVHLNSNSTLSYPANFDVDTRAITLEGEAFFEVAHNPNLPFVVATQSASIKVHGTSFNVLAYPNSPYIETSLQEGKVELILNGDTNKNVFLVAGEKATYYPQSNEITVATTDLYMETAWRRGDIVVRSQPIQMVFHKLEEFYGVSIAVEGSVPNRLFTGSFHEEDVNQVLINLQQHYDFAYTKIGQKISLKFN